MKPVQPQEQWRHAVDVQELAVGSFRQKQSSVRTDVQRNEQGSVRMNRGDIMPPPPPCILGLVTSI